MGPAWRSASIPPRNLRDADELEKLGESLPPGGGGDDG
jgi:hypothetical protein